MLRKNKNGKNRLFINVLSLILITLQLVSCSPFSVETSEIDVLESSENNFISQINMEALGDGGCEVIIPKDVLLSFELFSRQRAIESEEYIRQEGKKFNFTLDDAYKAFDIADEDLNPDGSASIKLSQEERQETISAYKELILMHLDKLCHSQEENSENNSTDSNGKKNKKKLDNSEFNPFISYEINETYDKVELQIDKDKWISLDVAKTYIVATHMIFYQFFRAIPQAEMNYTIDFIYEGDSKPFYRYVKKK